MSRRSALADWLHDRIGYRTLLRRLEDPASDPGWARTLGGGLLVLLIVQFVTGVTLMLYYVPTPTHAYDSVRYIVSQVPFGGLLRALHYHGASFIVAIALLHLLRTFLAGAYKAPRELTWLSGVALLTIIVGFGLTGYLLPWDQMGYWSTVVRTNIAGTTPVVGKWVAGIMKGGPSVGALTLSRWYMLHVVVLPACLALLALAHFHQLRRHGRAAHEGRAVRRARVSLVWRAARSLAVVVVTCGALAWWARSIAPPLESMADPADFSFIPHPEWYFLWLFQLMKFDQGPIGQMGAPVVLMLVVGFLVLLPFLDPRRAGYLRPRAWVVGCAAAGLACISALTWAAIRGMPAQADPNVWSPIAIAGDDIVGRSACLKCHGPDSVAPDLRRGRIAHSNAWIKNHMSDPNTMAPGIRPIPFDAPTAAETVAVLAYVRKVRLGAPEPEVSKTERAIAVQYTIACASCHVMDGDGINDGPDLTHAGRERDSGWIAEKIVDPTAEDPKARMPSLADKMSKEEVRLMAEFLARRK